MFIDKKREIETSIEDGVRECVEQLRSCRDIVKIKHDTIYEPFPEKSADYLCVGFANELKALMYEDQDTLDQLNKKIIQIDDKRDEIE